MIKTCKKCGDAKGLTDFPLVKANRDGRSGTCSRCTNARVAARRSPAIAQTRAEWWTRNREKQRAYAAAYRERNKLKCSARAAVGYALKAGRLAPASACECNDCRAPAVELHHESYEPEHWLDVVPLCVSCHKKRHRTPN